MKKFVSVLASLALALALVPAVVFATSGSSTNLADATISAIEAQDCTGTAVAPTISVTLNGEELTANSEYTVTYANNVEPGTASVTIAAVDGSGLTGTQTVEFTINNNVVFTVYDCDVNGDYCGVVAEYTYPELQELAAANEGNLYTIYNSTNVQASTSYITFDQIIADAYEAAGIEDPWTDAEDASSVYARVMSSDGTGWGTKGSSTKYYSKETLSTTYGYFYPNLTSSEVSAEGAVSSPASICLNYNSKSLSSYSNAQAAGEAAAAAVSTQLRTSVGTSITDGTLTTPAGYMMWTSIQQLYVFHEIDQLDLAYATVEGIEDADCTGAPVTQSFTVTAANGEALASGTEYTVAYENNVEPGTATVTITAVEDSGYTGSQTIEYTINDNVVFTVYDCEIAEDGSYGDKQVVAEYTYSQLEALAAQNTTTLACQYFANVQASSKYVTFDQLVEDAYASQSALIDPYTNATDESSVYLWTAAPDGSSRFMISKADLNSYYGYFYEDGVYDGSYYTYSESQVGTASPYALMMSYGTASLSNYANAAEAKAAALEAETVNSSCFRTSCGTSIADTETGQEVRIWGYMVWSMLNSVTVYHYEIPADLADANVYASRMNKILPEGGSITVEDSDVRVYWNGSIVDSSYYTFEVVDAEGNVVADNTITETGTYYINVTGDDEKALGTAQGRIIIIDQNTKTYTISSK